MFGGKNAEDEDFDVDDAELERELAEIQAITASVNKAKAPRRSEPTGGKAGSRGKQTVEQQLLGEIPDDIDDDELEAELLSLIESEQASSYNEPSRKHPKNDSPIEDDSEMPVKTRQQPSSSNRLPVAPPPRTSSQQSVGSEIQPKPVETAPPLPPRRTSDVPQPAPQQVPQPVPQQAPQPESAQDTKSKAKNLLLRRREAFATNAKLAVEDGNSEYAKECAENVVMFDQALEACEEQEITMEDLEDIPATPPPYKKRISAPKPGTKSLAEELQIRIAKFKEVASECESKGDGSKARMQRRLCSQLEDALRMHTRGRPIHPETLPTPVGFEKLPAMQGGAAPSQGVAPSASGSRLSAPVQPQAQITRSASPSPARSQEVTLEEKIEQLKAKSLQYKAAALKAKKQGDLPAATKYLQAAKLLEKDIEKLNPAAAVPKPTFSANASDVQITPASKLFANLKHQLEFTMKLRTQFSAIKDTKRTLFYDELIKKCSADLKICHQEVKSGHDALMRFKINELNLPTLEINPGIPVDTLELKILSITNLRMPEGWKASDGATFVTYEFPYPHDAHQTGRTQIVYKTDSPEFDESFQLKINRKTKQLQRICQRQAIKFSVYQKGGFLRSDKFCGEADVHFSAVINQATLCVEQDLLDHRKKTGAQISIEIRVQKPLDEKKMNTVKTYPWIRLVDSKTL